MNVLSLFDGMSCAQIALIEQGIKIDTYYASEIDKHAIGQTQFNFPNTIQLGSVVDVDVSKLKPIDILFGGSPCQSFSFAGKRKGMATKCDIEILTLEHYLELKLSGFQFEGQSYLFWEYMRVLTDIRKYNPNVLFLLENVEMGEKWEKVLTQAIGIEGLHINSALVSAQNRKRIYWTNIGIEKRGLFDEYYPGIPQPKDKGILLRDILESEVLQKYYLSDKALATVTRKREIGINAKINPEKSGTITCGNQSAKFSIDNSTTLIVASRGRNPENPKSRKSGLETEQQLEARKDGKTNCLTSVQKDNLVMQINPSTESGGKQPYQQNRVYNSNGISPALCDNKADLIIKEATTKGYTEIAPGECFDFENPNSETRRGRKMDDKSNCLMAAETKFMQYTTDYRIRRLTPTECARLQTIPTWYKWNCSDTQQYRMLGNGWTIDVIKHILSFAKF